MMKLKSMIAAVLFTLTGLPSLSALTYSDNDLLLVFRREGFNDVLFNIGSISNFLGLADGTRVTVTNWSVPLVLSNFNGQLGGAFFTLQATTSTADAQRRVWLTDAGAPETATDLSGSRWSQLYSKIDFLGVQAQTMTGTNGVMNYVVSPNDSSSYTYIASSGGLLDITTLSGLAPFPLESAIPAILPFFEMKVNNTSPKPAAVQIGSFALGVDGSLVFTAGPTPVALPPLPKPTLVQLTRVGGVTTVSFTTTNGANYRLRYTANPGANPAYRQWSASSISAMGNGGVMTLQDSTDDPWRFYGIEVNR